MTRKTTPRQWTIIKHGMEAYLVYLVALSPTAIGALLPQQELTRPARVLTRFVRLSHK